MRWGTKARWLSMRRGLNGRLMVGFEAFPRRFGMEIIP
jgi:hypothetical protein